jgi:hypothetical protein
MPGKFPQGGIQKRNVIIISAVAITPVNKSGPCVHDVGDAGKDVRFTGQLAFPCFKSVKCPRMIEQENVLVAGQWPRREDSVLLTRLNWHASAFTVVKCKLERGARVKDLADQLGV